MAKNQPTQKEKCADCKYFKPLPIPGMDGQGQCRKNAPGQQGSPVVAVGSWCGDFAPKAPGV